MEFCLAGVFWNTDGSDFVIEVHGAVEVEQGDVVVVGESVVVGVDEDVCHTARLIVGVWGRGGILPGVLGQAPFIVSKPKNDFIWLFPIIASNHELI